MEFVATQRCPACKGSNTIVSVVETPRTHMNHSPGAESRWTCVDCRHVFKPSNVHESSPVLMCQSCQAPTAHAYRKVARGIFKSVGDMRVTDGSIFHEIYACACGAERIFGFANVSIYSAVATDAPRSVA